MSRLWLIKCAVVAGWVAGAFLLAAPGTLSGAYAPRAGQTQNGAASGSDEYVGSDTCAACHEVESKSFSQTTHSRLAEAGWKGKVTGCESCHGPGKAHVEADGDKTKIRTFEKETSKQVSDTCLACHAGKEEHNNFIRGEHWRNDVGCTDCHTPHASSHPLPAPRSDGSSSLQPVGPS